MTNASLARSTVALLVARVIGQILAIALTVLLATRLGLTGFGQYAFATAVVFVANIVTTFGTDMVLIRDSAGGGRTDRYAPALALQMALSAVAATLLCAIAAALPATHGDTGSALRIMSASLFPAALFSVSTAALRGHGRMRAYAALTVAAAAAPLAGVATLVPAGAGVVRASIVLVGAQIVVAALAWAACALALPQVRVVALVDATDVVAMARASASIGVLGVLGVVYQRCGAIAVAIVVGPAATGWFAGAQRITEASKTGHVALFTGVYPAMAQAHAGARSRRSLAWSSAVSVVAAALIAVLLLLTGSRLIDHLYGASFSPAATGGAVLAVAVVPSTIATYQALSLLAMDRAADALRALATSLAVLVTALVVLLPAVGWIGACWATLVADTTNATLTTLRRRAHPARGRTRRSVVISDARGQVA